MRTVRLGEVCQQCRESVKPGTRGELRYIGLESIGSGTGQFVEGTLSKTPEAPQANSFRFGPEHILYGKLRPYLNKVALPNFEGKCSTEIIPLLPSAEADRAYLAFFLRSQQVVDQISARTAGARMPRADMDFVFSLPAPLPLLPEQRRIVDILSRAEGIVRLRHEAEKKAAELIPSLFLNMFGDPVANPKGWDTKELQEILVETKLGLVRGARETSDDKPYQYLRMDAVGGGLVRTTRLKRIDATEPEINEYALRPGDFLFNTRNSKELVGKTGIFVGAEDSPILFNNNLMRMRFDEGMMLPEFVNAQFQTDYIKDQLESIKRGTTTVFAIYYKDLKGVRLRVPKLDLQRDFVSHMQNIRSIQSQQSAAIDKAQATFSALLAQAFNG